MNQQGINRLERHREDYQEFTGKPFEHFFCPILFVDEPSELIRGHVINDSFRGSSKICVVQRKDVDGFYGRFFECDFQLLQYTLNAADIEFFTNPKLFAAARPRLLFAGKEMKYFLRHKKDWSKRPPEGFQVMSLDDSCPVKLAVRAEPEQMTAPSGLWELETGKDLKLPAYISLVKAAHLSMFALFGYRYVFSVAGRLLGEDILGKFYRDNRNVGSKHDAQRSAFEFFRPYKHMVRPMPLESTKLEGTLTDSLVTFCASTSGPPWGMMIFVRTGEMRHAVLLPYTESAESFAVYMGFLKNEHEQIHIMLGKYYSDNPRWEFNPERRPVCWPKDAHAYPRQFA